MTEAEALDLAAKAAGWGSWEYVKTHCDPGERPPIHAHAATLMENAALKAENERLRDERRLAWNEAIEAAALYVQDNDPHDKHALVPAIRALTKENNHDRSS